MTMLEIRSTSLGAPAERVRENLAFWPVAQETLQIHQTSILRTIVMGIADIAPNVDRDVVSTILPHLEEAYAQLPPRKFTKQEDDTPEPEINHALQVGILVAHAVGLGNLTTEQFIVSLGHDFYENTDRRLSELKTPRNPQMVSDTIIALSHKRNGVRIYAKDDKQPYFRGMIDNYREYPDIDVPLIKTCDQIVVANSPLTIDELQDPTSLALITSWNSMSQTKIGEMNMFLGSLTDAGFGECKAAKLLREAIPFTELRVRAVKETPREIPLLRR